MVKLIIGFIPLAMVAITPAMLVVVLYIINLERGLLRACFFMAGRLLTYAGWSVVLFAFTDRAFDLTPGGPSLFGPLLKVILGIFLVAMALKVALGGNDPDALPTKISDILSKISFLQLFGIGVLVSIFQVRHILILFVGITEIIVAEISVALSILTVLILILLINASQLTLIGVYYVFSDRPENFIQSLDSWLTKNSRQVAIFIGLVGIFMILDGVNELGIFG